ncbi:MAG: two-component regulator propeller domain-containing protein [Chloroflexota bacterium]
MLATLTVPTASAGLIYPNPRGNCFGVGSLPEEFINDPDFCGCIWGAVYYNGEPVEGANVTLSFNGQAIQDTTALVDPDIIPFPYYSMTGNELGAQLGDVMTLTVEYNGQTTVRAYRAWPDDAKVQRVDHALPLSSTSTPSWASWISGGYTSTMTLWDDTTIVAGGVSGLIQVDAVTGVETPIDLPWVDARVFDMGVISSDEANSAVLVVSDQGAAIWDGNEWSEPSPQVPIEGSLYRVAISANENGEENTAWVAGGNGTRELAKFDDSWTTITLDGLAPSAWISDLAVDDEGQLWVATWGDGVYRIDEDGTQIQFTTEDGLAADEIYALLVTDTHVWVAAHASLNSNSEGQAFGGVGGYNNETQTWATYTDGLPMKGNLVEEVRSLAMDDGVLLAGTDAGLFKLNLAGDDDSWAPDPAWNDHPEYQNTPIYHLLAMGNGLIAITESGISRIANPNLNDAIGVTDSSSSLVQTQLASETLIDASGVLTMTGSILSEPAPLGSDNTLGTTPVAWEWSSNIDGLLCTTAGSCAWPLTHLTAGTHEMSVRVQTLDGLWSDYGMAEIVVPAAPDPSADTNPGQGETPKVVYLPVVSR